jgi:acyl carrier protein
LGKSAKQIKCRIADRFTNASPFWVSLSNRPLSGVESSAIPDSAPRQRRLPAKTHLSSMKPTKEELIDIIYECLGEVNDQLPKHQQIRRSPDAILFGRDGGLDSLGFVNFIALVEEKCEHKYGITVSLTEVSSSEDITVEDVGRFADSLLQCLSKAIPEV